MCVFIYPRTCLYVFFNISMIQESFLEYILHMGAYRYEEHALSDHAIAMIHPGQCVCTCTYTGACINSTLNLTFVSHAWNAANHCTWRLSVPSRRRQKHAE